MTSDCALIVFAKAPVPGYAKTRLAPQLGNEGAARLASRMLAETLRQAIAADIGPVELCCTPDPTHPAFLQAADTYGIALTLQGDGDLGARMRRALAQSLGKHERATLIGTDAPGIDARYLQVAAQALLGHAAVFAPAVDGGYALIGLSRPMPFLFDGMEWSTPQVMAQTRERLRLAGVKHVELPVVADVDEPEDLVHLPKEWLE